MKKVFKKSLFVLFIAVNSAVTVFALASTAALLSLLREAVNCHCANCSADTSGFKYILIIWSGCLCLWSFLFASVYKKKEENIKAKKPFRSFLFEITPGFLLIVTYFGIMLISELLIFAVVFYVLTAGFIVSLVTSVIRIEKRISRDERSEQAKNKTMN